MLKTDSTELNMTCAAEAAMAAWGNAIEHFLSHGRDTPVALAQVLAADPDCVLAWCAKGLFTTLLARCELAAPARDALAQAEASVRRRGATPRELLYVEALRWSTEGSLSRAVAILEQILDDHPRDSLAAKLSHGMRFILGDTRGMRLSIERVVARAGLDHPHLGYLLGCMAFALEETGAYQEAERIGYRAIERAPRDAWGVHAISHVYEMTGRAAAGAEFLTAHARSFEHCNNFGYHVFWHLALFRLEVGDVAGTLRLYDERIRAEKTDDFRDIANAVSLLARLEIAGAEVGNRWNELGELAERRIADRTLVFASLHYAVALIGAGKPDVAAELAFGLSQPGMSGDQVRIATEIGAPVAAALTAFGAARYAQAAESLLAVRPKLRQIGGSNAQRDLFEQVLIEASVRAGHAHQATQLLRERLRARGTNRFAAERLEELGVGSFRSAV